MQPTTRPPRRYTTARRKGRISRAQSRALTELLGRYEIPPAAYAERPLDFAALFGSPQPPGLEIGFGDGEALLAVAETDPQQPWLGIELYPPGIGRLLLGLAERELTNVRVMLIEAGQALETAIPPESLAAIHLFFPDPWPKARHHKRRLIQPDFAALAASRLRPGGRLHVATDWPDYAAAALEVLDAEPALENTAGQGAYAPRGDRPQTKFERRGLALGHPVVDLVYVRRGEGLINN